MINKNNLCGVFAVLIASQIINIHSSASAQTVATDAAASPGQPATPPPPAAASVSVGEIVVTAQRRSENLQNVPITVTAVTATKLAQSGVSGTEDLSLLVPGLSLEDSIGFASPHLRGIGTSANGPGVENPVATYVDGVYIAAAPASLLSFNNIAQIDVLKGPQGTLFGRNTTGGLIQVTTPDPKSRFQGNASFSYGDYDTSRADLYVTGGLTDNISADFAAQLSHQGDGYGTNFYSGKPTYKTDRDIALRSKLLWKPTDKTEVRVIADYENSANSNSARPYPGTTLVFGSNFGGTPWDANSDFHNENHYQGGGLSLNVKQDLGFADLISITAYRQSQYSFAFDYDATPMYIENFSNDIQKDNQFSQELQLTSRSSSFFTWTTGLYYFTSDARFDPVEVDIGPVLVSAASPLTQVDVLGDERTNSIAGYGQATVTVAPDTHLTAGLRYTYETRDYRGDDFGYILSKVPIGPLFPEVTGSVKTSQPTWRISLDHRFNDELLAYFSYNRGFKNGGFNVSDPTNKPYSPEKLDAYEVGLKSDLLDRRLRLNLSGFYYTYSNIQVARFTTGAIDFYNGASADLYGLDVDFDAAVTADLRLSGGFELLHDRFSSFPDAELSHPIPTGGYFETTGSAKGNRLPYAPDATFNLAGDYSHHYDFGLVNLNLSYAYNTGWFPEPDNVLRQKPFSAINTSGTFSPGDNGWSVTLWAKNLTNAAVSTQLSTTGFFDSYSVAPPRTYGFTIRKQF